ncbi:hypothetical protein KM043_003662 [Ampulex compressa]|nr:hypothetical protein KM043_003662 [Ampulex compressa]
MTKRMRLACITFALLAVAFSDFVVGSVVEQRTELNETSPRPLVVSTDNATTTAQPTNATVSPTNVTTTVPTTIVTKPVPPQPHTTNSTPTTTSTTPPMPTTKSTVTPIPTTHIPTTQPTPHTTSHPTSIPTPHPTATGAGPTATPTETPPPSKERHFDGLSFLGGIILTTCLMGIAAFTWKFYRTCNEGNYRTL